MAEQHFVRAVEGVCIAWIDRIPLHGHAVLAMRTFAVRGNAPIARKRARARRKDGYVVFALGESERHLPCGALGAPRQI